MALGGALIHTPGSLSKYFRCCSKRALTMCKYLSALHLISAYKYLLSPNTAVSRVQIDRLTKIQLNSFLYRHLQMRFKYISWAYASGNSRVSMMCLAPEIVPVCPSLLQIESGRFSMVHFVRSIITV